MNDNATRYFVIALHVPGDELPYYKVCAIGHSTLAEARRCWFDGPDDLRQTILTICREKGARVVIWESEVVDRIHSIEDA